MLTTTLIIIGVLIIFFIISRTKKQKRFNSTYYWLLSKVEFDCTDEVSKLTLEQKYAIYNILNIFGEFTFDDPINSNKVRQLLLTWLNALKIDKQNSLNYFKEVNESGTIQKLKEIKNEFIMDMVFYSAYAFTHMANGHINGISCRTMSTKILIEDFKKLGFDNNKFGKAKYLFSH